jgi:hypothetical protein
VRHQTPVGLDVIGDEHAGQEPPVQRALDQFIKMPGHEAIEWKEHKMRRADDVCIDILGMDSGDV